jgi:hypothetical protein
MALTIHDIKPIALCIATQELFDTKRFRENFCDNLILKAKDKEIERLVLPIKREIISPPTSQKFLEGHKIAIISNLDKILSLVSTRYARISLRKVEEIVKSGKELIKKVLAASTFEEINSFEPLFRTKISLPTYSLFIEAMRQLKIDVV